MTLQEVTLSRPIMDRARIATTTGGDIHRHQIEDGQDPGTPTPPFRAVPNVRAIRTRLRMTEEAFGQAIGVPVATVRDWEQSRTSMDQAVRSLLRDVEREPGAVPQALAGAPNLAETQVGAPTSGFAPSGQ
jgi:putative transcriptional regulator